METLLLLSQIIFNFVVSLAILALGIALGIAAYRLARIAKNLHTLSEGVVEFSKETEDRIRDILDNLEDVPIFSFLFKKKKKRSQRSLQGKI